ncbi:HEAT repeat domain-containing protein [Chondromyces apiculatus]|uniref:HEAT repeat protein n=1 Tax=Chondromyces apiculatus DSM 436 TaxID=1192034 RepID=A0A017T081_9BACT|nr:HEAT repeat domain-containing protein [Chondromyces apiculatus]EYF02644.1 Hypothetical protein CAP_6674 [Chondromyces apiculatus DSM 436]
MAQSIQEFEEVLQGLRSTTAPPVDAKALAVARGGREALERALEAAEADDTWDHRLLRLLLQAVALSDAPGAGVDRAFARRVLEEVVRRWMQPSGRFGEAEQRLGVEAERGFQVLGAALGPEDRKVLAPLLEGRGALGTEALLLGWAAGLEGLRRPPSERQAARVGAALARRGATVAEVIALAGGRNFRVRAAAVRALASDPEAIPQLREAMRDENRSVREAAVGALALDPGAVPLLRQALCDEGWGVRAAAVGALWSDPESRPRIREALRDGWWRVELAAARALSSDPESRTQLRETLCSEMADLRARAFCALALAPASRPQLRAALRHEAWRVRAAAVEALASDPESRAQLREALGDLWWIVRRAAVGALASDAESRPQLREALRDEWWNVRAAAVEALSSDAESRPQLREALRDKDAIVRAAAVKALSSDPESRPLIREALRDEDGDVRAAAFGALPPDPEFRAQLREALRDEDGDVRAAAVGALSSDAESRPLLRAALRDEEGNVRAAAVAALQPRVRTQASPLSELPCVQAALRLASRHDPQLDAVLPSALPGSQERLARFLQSPRAVPLERDPQFAEDLLGAVCVRLTQTMESRFRIFGEVQEPREQLADGSGPIVIRIAMSAADLALDRDVLAVHNLVEAWRIARHLHTERDITVWLVCANLDFDDILPPVIDAPGTVCMRPPFFGFRLPTSIGTSLHAHE